MKGGKVHKRVVYRYYKIFIYATKLTMNNLYIIHYFTYLKNIYQTVTVCTYWHNLKKGQFIQNL